VSRHDDADANSCRAIAVDSQAQEYQIGCRDSENKGPIIVTALFNITDKAARVTSSKLAANRQNTTTPEQFAKCAKAWGESVASDRLSEQLATGQQSARRRFVALWATDLECLLSRRVLAVERTCRGHRDKGVHDPEPTSAGLADELKLPAHSGITLTIEDEIIFRAVARNCTTGGRGKVRWEN
jgi:hypothetical protein